MKTDILLESGTGEVEILEFIVNNKHYAINVIKVREVVDIDNLTELPNNHPSIDGVVLCRNEILTLINLSQVLDSHKNNNLKPFKAILCEFNKVKVAFKIDDIVAIHRIKWEQIRKPDEISTNPLVIGNILFKDNIILLLDFEKIITDINPKIGISEDKIKDIHCKDRHGIKIVLADDSALIRTLLKNTLNKAGFENLTFFNDGTEVLTYLNSLVEIKKENFVDDVQILITDIEMPQMDGHSLVRKIKEHTILRKLPCIIFSSLITDDLKHKGIDVGANAQISKPEIGELVDIIDEFVINK
ncbi:chemotaxis protein [Clostridium senegalense]|uniref:chemotaxis protein n=1 Tax=Clostridium senegalense TaxID=1465809 RepID=UPI001C1017CC|nr:chemotaxis protein [Clostridium senegalense]MBU5225445.1 chemotaxis protein [Clostridium senegalense]